MRLRLLGLLVLAATAQGALGSGTVPLVAPAKLHRAVVSGNWIAWSEYGTTFDTSSVYAIDVNNPTPDGRILVADKTAVVDTWAYWNSQLAMDGSSVFWVNDPAAAGPDFQIYKYNLADESTKVIGPTVWGYGDRPLFPSVSGSRLVWQAIAYGYDNGIPYMGLAISDPWTDDPSPVAAVATFPREPDSYQDGWPVPSISGPWVVWKDDRPSKKGGLWAYNVESKQTVVIKSPDPLFDVRAPVIDGNRVAWCQRDRTTDPAGIHQIVTFDLSNPDAGQKIIVADTGSPEHRSDISISGNVVVWEDWTNNASAPGVPIPPLDNAHIVAWNDVNANVDIRAWDLIHDQEIAIPDAMTAALELRPWIDGKRVVWYEAVLPQGATTRTLSLKWTEIPLPSGGPGDVNLDGLIDSRDISGFIEHLLTGTYLYEADTNGDGLVNSLDISRFIALLLGAPPAAAVPEPATGLLLLPVMALGLCRR